MKIVLFLLVSVLIFICGALLHDRAALGEQVYEQTSKLHEIERDKAWAEKRVTLKEGSVNTLARELDQARQATAKALAAQFNPDSLSPEFKLYAGRVSGRPTTFALRWLTPETVVGLMTRNNEQFAVAGGKTGDDRIFASVAFKGRTVAYLKASRSAGRWSGSMRVEENGAILPIDFQATGQSSRTATFVNHTDQKLTCAVAYLDSEQNSWTTKGYWTVEPGKSLSVPMSTLGNTYYFRAWGSDKLVWSGDANLAVGKHKAFTLKDADSYFPSFADESAKLNYEDDTETEVVSFMKQSFAEGSSQTGVTLTNRP